MALTATTFINDPTCLAVAWMDVAKGDGAIGRVELTNRGTVPLVGFATYGGKSSETPPVAPGTTYTHTFRGASPRAGDVTEYGYRV